MSSWAPSGCSLPATIRGSNPGSFSEPFTVSSCRPQTRRKSSVRMPGSCSTWEICPATNHDPNQFMNQPYNSSHLGIIAACLCSISLPLFAQSLPTNTNHQQPLPGSPLKILFSAEPDVADVWGRLHFGATPVRLIRECDPPGFTVVGCFPLPDGSWEGFGQQMTKVGGGKEVFEEVASWKLLRARTRDGVTFENPETVLAREPAPWTGHCAVAYRSEEHTSELQSRGLISYAVFCLKK